MVLCHGGKHNYIPRDVFPHGCVVVSPKNEEKSPSSVIYQAPRCFLLLYVGCPMSDNKQQTRGEKKVRAIINFRRDRDTPQGCAKGARSVGRGHPGYFL